MITNIEQIEGDLHGCWLAYSIDKYVRYSWIMRKILLFTFHFRFWQYGFREGYMAAIEKMKLAPSSEPQQPTGASTPLEE